MTHTLQFVISESPYPHRAKGTHTHFCMQGLGRWSQGWDKGRYSGLRQRKVRQQESKPGEMAAITVHSKSQGTFVPLELSCIVVSFKILQWSGLVEMIRVAYTLLRWKIFASIMLLLRRACELVIGSFKFVLNVFCSWVWKVSSIVQRFCKSP